MNQLASKKAIWLTDGSPGSTLHVSSSDEESSTTMILSMEAAKQGTPLNVRLDSTDGYLKGCYYFEVEIKESTKSLSIGVVLKKDFKAGWKTRGMFLNGNLTNGSAGLKIGFCESPRPGDTVGVFVKRSTETVEIIFYSNGRCLGPGFRIPEPLDSLFPCLHTDGKAEVIVRVPNSFPAIEVRQSASYADPYSGTWKLCKAFRGPELGEFPLPRGSLFTFKFDFTGENVYNLTLKIGNTMRTRMIVEGKIDQFDKISVNAPVSTRMLPNLETAETERFLAVALPDLSKMIVSENGDLVLTGATAELICQRYEETIEPLTSYN